jgi:hypothetical protein
MCRDILLVGGSRSESAEQQLQSIWFRKHRTLNNTVLTILLELGYRFGRISSEVGYRISGRIFIYIKKQTRHLMSVINYYGCSHH